VKEKLESLVLQMIDQEIRFEDACVEFERRFIRKVLEKVNGNKSKAAVALGSTVTRLVARSANWASPPTARRRRARR